MKVPTISIKILSTSTLLDLLICIWYKLNVFLLVLLASYFSKNLLFYSHHIRLVM